MSHTLLGNATAAIEVVGGLVANMSPTDLPEGASPRTFDTDFSTGSVFTRAGLVDIYGAVVNTPNFNWVGSYVQNDGAINTLALDSLGNMWIEDIINAPDVLTLVPNISILPGSYAFGTTADDAEFIMFSNLKSGTDRPRQYDGTNWYPVSQVGPGAPPSFQSTLGGQEAGTITSFIITSNVIAVTGTFAAPYEAGQVVTIGTITGPGSFLSGAVLSVLGFPTPTTTTFSAPYTHANITVTGISAAVTPQYSYPISSITQFPAVVIPVGTGLGMAQFAGIGSSDPGSLVGVFYAVGGGNTNLDQNIANAFKIGIPAYVYIANAPFGNGTWVIQSYGYTVVSGVTVQYFLYQINTVAHSGGTYSTVGATYQLSVGILTTSVPVPGLSVGSSIVVVGASGWNGTYTIEDQITGGVYNILTTQMNAAGVATYGYQQVSGQTQPTAGEPVTITNTLNGNGIFNVTDAVIGTVSGNTFTISGFTSPAIAQNIEQGLAQTSGTQFYIDPGSTLVGTVSPSPIHGNVTTGTLNIVGGELTVGAGTRQGVVFFITETAYETYPSIPVTFTTEVNGNYIYASNIPIGPPNTVSRAIAFTEAGANGVPGANFYVIPQNVVIPASVAGQALTYTATIINDNVTTKAAFTFTDAVLLNSLEIDIQGNNLFDLIELGSSAWCVEYASRMFYGLQLNKVQNLINTSFDGGAVTSSTVPAYSPTVNYDPGVQVIYLGSIYVSIAQTLNHLPTNATYWTVISVNGNIDPSGWTLETNLPASSATLVPSQVTGYSFLISNTTGVTQPTLGMLTQSAYQDYYQVPILNALTAYSVRIAASSINTAGAGNLVVDLTDYFAGVGYSKTYGTFSVPLSSMTTAVQVFTGPLITTGAFPNNVSANVLLRVWAQNLSAGNSVTIDRLEIFPTLEPVLLTSIYGSYVNDFESIDASGDGGIIDTSSENSQTCFGGCVMKNNLYLLKTSSMYITQDSPGTEPGGWDLEEFSPTVGTCGINAYCSGEGWIVTACRSGIYATAGKTPEKINQEIIPIWNAINWNAAQTIVMRNDTTNRRLLCAVPLPTGPGTASYFWLPNAIPNANPTSPNVMFMLNYQDIGSVEELIAAKPVHVTMFGTLMAPDQHRKWSIWQITSPYMDFITQADGLTNTLYLCNGLGNGKIYQLLATELSDDGVAINSLYTTTGAPTAAKAKEMPLWGTHRRLYSSMQLTFDSGNSNVQVRTLKDVLTDPYPYTIPNGFNLTTPLLGTEFYAPLNQKATRLFTEVSSNAVGASFTLCKVTLNGKADPWAVILPNPGGNIGL